MQEGTKVDESGEDTVDASVRMTAEDVEVVGEEIVTGKETNSQYIPNGYESVVIPKSVGIDTGNYESPGYVPYIPTTILPQSGDFAKLQETVNALGAMQSLAAVLIKSQLCPLKKEADVVLAIITGNQFGFPFMTSINNIYAVNGKPTLSAHLHRALLLTKGVYFKKIYDFEPLYDWAKTDENGKVLSREVKTANGTTQVPIILKRATRAEKPEGHCVASNEVDRITKYEFKRVIKLLDGSMQTLEAVGEFKMSDASLAGLLEKDNWAKYPSRMLDARSFTYGAREIASDVTLGIPTVGELADASNIPYVINESLQESLLTS